MSFLLAILSLDWIGTLLYHWCNIGVRWVFKDPLYRLWLIPVALLAFSVLAIQVLLRGIRGGWVERSRSTVAWLRIGKWIVNWSLRLASVSIVISVIVWTAPLVWQEFHVRWLASQLTSTQQTILKIKYLEEQNQSEPNKPGIEGLLLLRQFVREMILFSSISREVQASFFVHARERLTELRLIEDSSYYSPPTKKREDFFPDSVLDNLKFTTRGRQVAEFLAHTDPEWSLRK